MKKKSIEKWQLEINKLNSSKRHMITISLGICIAWVLAIIFFFVRLTHKSENWLNQKPHLFRIFFFIQNSWIYICDCDSASFPTVIQIFRVFFLSQHCFNFVSKQLYWTFFFSVKFAQRKPWNWMEWRGNMCPVFTVWLWIPIFHVVERFIAKISISFLLSMLLSLPYRWNCVNRNWNVIWLN